MILISQHVDTFKEALYLKGDTIEYNKFICALMEFKEEAQFIHHQNNDLRFVNFVVGGIKFQVMATSITGYSVTMKNQDISIAFRKRGDTKTDKNPSIKIEYRASYLVKYGIKDAYETVKKFVQTYIHKDYISKAQEIHLAADTQGYNFTLLDMKRFKNYTTKAKYIEGDGGELGRHMIFNSEELETMYFGSSNNLLRIYNKSKEIKIHPDSAHSQLLWNKNPDYNEENPVWRIEFQIRKPILKTLFNAYKESFEFTEVLLNNLPSIWTFCHSYYSMKDLDQETVISLILGYRILKSGIPKPYTKTAIKRLKNKADLHDFWKLITFYNATKADFYFRFNQVKQSLPIYAMNSVCACISTIIKHYGEYTPELQAMVMRQAEERSLKNHEIGLIDNGYKKTADYMLKIEKQRKLGLDIIEVDDSVKDNLDFYIGQIVSPYVAESAHQPIF